MESKIINIEPFKDNKILIGLSNKLIIFDFL